MERWRSFRLSGIVMCMDSDLVHSDSTMIETRSPRLENAKTARVSSATTSLKVCQDDMTMSWMVTGIGLELYTDNTC